MQKITLARNAMATRFELVLVGENPIRLRAAGEEALEEIDRIEAQLSLYRGGSEIANINANAAFRQVPVSAPVFGLLQKAFHFWELSGGAFDITVAPLVRCWGFMKGTGSRPTDAEIADARERVGMNLLELNATRLTVRFARPGMMLDLGSIGKGYALDVAADILRDAGVQNALLHGGSSTIYALGADLGGPWKVAIDQPSLPGGQPPGEIPPKPLAVVELADQSLSVSAVSGKFFTIEGRNYGHVIDPRTGWSVENALLSSVVVNSGADSDALSTAVLLGSEADLERLKANLPNLRFLQFKKKNNSEIETISRGIELLESEPSVKRG